MSSGQAVELYRPFLGGTSSVNHEEVPPEIDLESACLLTKYIKKYVIQGEVIPVSLGKKILRTALKVGSIAVSSMAREAYIGLNYDAGRRIAGEIGASILGPVFSIGSVGAYAALVIKACFDTIDEEMRPVSPEELRILGNKPIGCMGTVVIWSSSVLAGVIANFPFAYVAYDVNDNSIFGFTTIMASDTWIPIHSSLIALKYFSHMKRRNPLEKELLGVRREIVGFLHNAQELLCDGDPKKRKTLGNIIKIAKQQEGTESVRQMFTSLYEETRRPIATAREQKVSLCRRIAHRVSDVASAIFTGCQWAFYGWVGYLGMHTFSSNPEFAVFTGCLVALTNLAFNGKNVVTTGRRIVDRVISCFTRKPKHTLAETLYPKLSMLTKMLSHLICITAAGGPFEVCMEYLGNVDSTLQAVGTSIITIGSVMIVTAAVSDITSYFLDLGLQSCGSREFKKLRTIHDRLEALSRVIENSESRECVKFTEQVLPSDFYTNICEKVGTTRERLASFLADREEDPLLVSD